MKNIFYAFAMGSLTFMISCGSHESKVYTDDTPAVDVNTSVADSKAQSDYIELNGKIESAESAVVSTRMMGFIERINVKLGDAVRRGQLLIKINSLELKAKEAQINATILEAESALANVQKNYERISSLYQSESATKKELDDISAQLKMAQARLQGAKEMKNEIRSQYTYTDIKSPINGLVTKKNVNEGDMANPGQLLLEIESQKAYQVVCYVPESTISQVSEGDTMNVSVGALGENLKAVVSELSYSAKHTSGTYLVKMLILENPEGLRAGMYATILQEDSSSADNNTISIPESAVFERGELKGIYVVSDDNKALLRWLRLGEIDNGMYKVISGLDAGEKFITQADTRLYNGAPVNAQ